MNCYATDTSSNRILVTTKCLRKTFSIYIFSLFVKPNYRANIAKMHWKSRKNNAGPANRCVIRITPWKSLWDKVTKFHSKLALFTTHKDTIMLRKWPFENVSKACRSETLIDQEFFSWTQVKHGMMVLP